MQGNSVYLLPLLLWIAKKVKRRVDGELTFVLITMLYCQCAVEERNDYGKENPVDSIASKKTQQEVAESSGVAISYLSRLENDRIAPTVRTLGRIATAMKVPLTSLFDAGEVLEAADRCPVSLSGSCILDQVFAGRGQNPKVNVESYSPQ